MCEPSANKWRPLSLAHLAIKATKHHYNSNRNRKLQTSKAPLKSLAQGTSLFTSAASNQRGFPKNSPWEAQVRFPEGERMRQIRGVFQRIVRWKLRSGCQKVRGGRLGVKAGVVWEGSGKKWNQVSQRKRA